MHTLYWRYMVTYLIEMKSVVCCVLKKASVSHCEYIYRKSHKCNFPTCIAL